MSEYLLATKNDRKASRYGAYMVQEAVFGPEEGPEAGSYMVYNVLQNTTSYHATPLYAAVLATHPAQMHRLQSKPLLG